MSVRKREPSGCLSKTIAVTWECQVILCSVFVEGGPLFVSVSSLEETQHLTNNSNMSEGDKPNPERYV